MSISITLFLYDVWLATSGEKRTVWSEIIITSLTLIVKWPLVYGHLHVQVRLKRGTCSLPRKILFFKAAIPWPICIHISVENVKVATSLPRITDEYISLMLSWSDVHVIAWNVRCSLVVQIMGTYLSLCSLCLVKASSITRHNCGMLISVSFDSFLKTMII